MALSYRPFEHRAAPMMVLFHPHTPRIGIDPQNVLYFRLNRPERRTTPMFTLRKTEETRADPSLLAASEPSGVTSVSESMREPPYSTTGVTHHHSAATSQQPTLGDSFEVCSEGLVPILGLHFFTVGPPPKRMTPAPRHGCE